MGAHRLPRQALPMLAAAVLLLAAIIALAVWFNSQQDQRRSEVERDALEMARQIIDLADAELSADRRILLLMAASPTAGDLPQFDGAFARQVRNNRDWVALILRDRATGQVLLERADAPDAKPLRPLPAGLPSGALVEGAFAEGRYCPCVILHAALVENPERVITLYVNPEKYQGIVTERSRGAILTGLVDREGRFAGRSLDFAARVGKPGSSYLRRAVARGGEGLYPAISLEGMRNYTAYVTSPDTGWSGHVAIERKRIDGLRNWGNLSVVTGVLAALVLAVGLLVFAANETRARRREEDQLIAMQKAEAISRFTSTTVHDFRNILAVIDAGAKLIERHTQEPGTLERAAAIHGAVERGRRMINQLLSFVRGGGAEVGPFNLETLLANCDELIGRSLGDDIVYTWRVAEDARHVRGNEDQIELALLNLAINARDAMNGPGEFTIAAARDGDMVAIAAGDTGPGVPRELRSRIFDTFYSTKGDGQGTGLGLAQVAGAARQAGGRVELRDQAEGGASFVIYLPREGDS